MSCMNRYSFLRNANLRVNDEDFGLPNSKRTTNKQFRMPFVISSMTFLLVMACTMVKAQVDVERSKNITMIGGKEYYMHHVKPGQTLYSISVVYNVSIAELEKINPEVKNGLKSGLVLGIPVRPLNERDSLEQLEVKPKVDSNDDPMEKFKEESNAEFKEESKVERIECQGKADNKKWFSSNGRVVQEGEDLYDIAKEYGIDVADLKKANTNLGDTPQAGTVISIPAIVNENDYIIHYCNNNERVSTLLKRWKVDEDAFRAKNVSVGSHVFVNQVILIPIDPVTDFYWISYLSNDVGEEEIKEDENVETQPMASFRWDFDEELSEIPVCMASLENANRSYNVALMIPLYLNDIGDIVVSKSNKSSVQKSRSLAFLQFYEGFMMAAETLKMQGLKLNLSVIDVTDNVATAELALNKIKNQELDMIVGPFFGKSFGIIEDYAKQHGIIMVNPLSERSTVIEDSPNVVKVKPNPIGMVLSISNLIKNSYSDANVLIVSRDHKADSALLKQLEHHLNLAVNEEVSVSGDKFLQFARNESQRLEMGSRLLSTVDVEGQVYSTTDFQNGVANDVVLTNMVKHYSYSDMAKVKSCLSGVRNNVIIAYGDDNVFATQILNSLTKDADRFPITLICAPNWSKHEKLLVDNLLKMNAIYVSDFFVDYKNEAVKDFVATFREKYVSEPQNYAFEGYDIGYYFLSALMKYGNEDLIGCLHCHEASLLHTNYRFYYRNYFRPGNDDGKENYYWSMYQFDNELIELVPVDPFKQNAGNE